MLVNPARIDALNAGTAEAKNLSEWLAVDFQKLLRTAFPKVNGEIDPKAGIVKRMAQGGELFRGNFENLMGHRSDTVRGWAAFAVAATPGLKLKDRFALIRPLADDGNSGVREWAWLALRSDLEADLALGLRLAASWTGESSPNLRRFASEWTRPRGVWCTHLAELKKDPAPGLAILEPLRADPAKYVQDSVSNWLNDASKSKPAWVREVCARWEKQSRVPATARICKRALRSIS